MNPLHYAADDAILHSLVSYSNNRQTNTNIDCYRTDLSAPSTFDLGRISAWGSTNHTCCNPSKTFSYFNRTSLLRSVKSWVDISLLYWVTSVNGLNHVFLVDLHLCQRAPFVLRGNLVSHSASDDVAFIPILWFVRSSNPPENWTLQSTVSGISAYRPGSGLTKNRSVGQRSSSDLKSAVAFPLPNSCQTNPFLSPLSLFLFFRICLSGSPSKDFHSSLSNLHP